MVIRDGLHFYLFTAREARVPREGGDILSIIGHLMLLELLILTRVYYYVIIENKYLY